MCRYTISNFQGSSPAKCLKTLAYMILACIALPFIILYFIFVLLIHIPVQWFLYFWKRFYDDDLEAANEIEIVPIYGAS